MNEYDRIEKAIIYVTSQVGSQPSLEKIANHVHLSPYHFQRMFTRWAGVTPKKYLQVLTVDRAKRLLNESKPIMKVSHEVGLSSGSRLYDHFVTLEAVTPGEYKARGENLDIDYGVHKTPFGEAFIAVTKRGICKFSFLGHSSEELEILNLKRVWSLSKITKNVNKTSDMVSRMFDIENTFEQPLSLVVSGTNFQVSVWRALLNIPLGRVNSYAQVAEFIQNPKAVRAVGTAIGMNPIAYLIPCHRVIQKSGKLGGYHWGEARKHALHLWETAKVEAS